jgi:leader peptidase (prepilin peptidase)/N-methyltransferase
MWDPERFAAVPFHFWSAVFFVFGATVGSFLNVCIYRMPREESLFWPPSHCPACGKPIPWYLNLPLVGWVALRGKCAACRAPISPRYVLVELLTALLFLGAWLAFGRQSAALALASALFLSGLVVATFIDFEHFIIPDEITLGGAGAGFLLSFVVPELHHTASPVVAAQRSLVGALAGWAVMYGVLRLGKLLFGRERIRLEPGTRVFFGETGLVLPDREIPYDDLLYREQDVIQFEAERVELADRCYRDVSVRLSRTALEIGEDRFAPEQTPFLEAVTDQLNLPREAMGLGDVKFMTAIGAFLGWDGALFALMASAVVGAAVGVLAILSRRREWSSRIPYGPYLAVAAAVWLFAGERLVAFWLRR